MRLRCRNEGDLGAVAGLQPCDFSSLVVAQLPPLLCGWKPGGDVVDDKEALIERVAELELRVAQLERENMQLRALQPGV